MVLTVCFFCFAGFKKHRFAEHLTNVLSGGRTVQIYPPDKCHHSGGHEFEENIERVRLQLEVNIKFELPGCKKKKGDLVMKYANARHKSETRSRNRKKISTKKEQVKKKTKSRRRKMMM